MKTGNPDGLCVCVCVCLCVCVCACVCVRAFVLSGWVASMQTILGMGSPIERRRCIVTSCFIGWVHTQNGLWTANVSQITVKSLI